MAVVRPGDRKRTGFKKKGAEGKYPMATEAQCKSAVRLRGHGKGVSRGEVLSKASSAASKNNWSG